MHVNILKVQCLLYLFIQSVCLVSSTVKLNVQSVIDFNFNQNIEFTAGGLPTLFVCLVDLGKWQGAALSQGKWQGAALSQAQSTTWCQKKGAILMLILYIIQVKWQ